MKKLLIILLILLSSIVSAAILSDYKECVQRGYETTRINNISHCVLPDGNTCPIGDFNEGLCGLEYKTEDYCVKEGTFVWDRDKCCEGTEAYMPPNVAGQPTCRKISIFQKLVNQIKYSDLWYIHHHPKFRSRISTIIFITIVFVIFWILRKKAQLSKIRSPK